MLSKAEHIYSDDFGALGDLKVEDIGAILFL